MSASGESAGRSPGSPGGRAPTSTLGSAGYGWYVLALLTTANFLHYANRNVLFSMYEDLRQTFGLSNSELGLLGTGFMLGHAVMTPVVGWAGDRFDRRRLIAAGIVTWSAAGVASALAVGFVSLFVSRALIGVATAACVPLCNALLCEVFPQGEKARTVAIFNLGLFVGGAAGFGLGTLGYPWGLWLLAVPGLAIALWVARLDVPARRVSGEANLAFRDFTVQAWQLLRVPTMRWVLCGAAIMAFSAGGYQAWFFEFLDKVKGLGQGKTFALMGVSFFGGLLGILSGGIVADRLQRRLSYGRLAAISLGMVCTVPIAFASLYLPVGPLFYASSWLTMYFIMWYHGPMAAVIDDLAIDDRAATAQAVVIFVMHLIGTAPSSWLIGEIADRHDLQTAMLVPTLGVLVAAAVLVGGWRTMARDRARARAVSSGASGSGERGAGHESPPAL